MTYRELSTCFDLLPVTRAGDPCHYAFCLPNQQALARWPDFPAVARPSAGRVAAGRGVDADQCAASALGEAVELASACVWGDEALVQASLADLGDTAWTPKVLLGFSDAQMQAREVWNASPFGGLDWRPEPLEAQDKIDWMVAITPEGDRVHVPADFALVGRREEGDAQAVALGTTSGCAAAETIAQARLRALLEVIERDAIGRWWYGGATARTVPIEALDLPGPVADFVAKRSRVTQVVALQGLGGTVLAAVSWTENGQEMALGFGCALDVASAGVSAIVELFQIEIGLEQRARAQDPLLTIWLQNAGPKILPPVEDGTVPEPDEKDLDSVLASLARAGKRCAFLDLTRPAFGVPVVRAIVPGMWSDKPRYAGFERQGRPAPEDRLPLLV